MIKSKHHMQQVVHLFEWSHEKGISRGIVIIKIHYNGVADCVIASAQSTQTVNNILTEIVHSFK